jgi:hypothetical protein
MRRRRPSALYTVLDEEQLLGGVDLADHPDAFGDRSGGGRGEEWDEWSPDAEEEPRDEEEGDEEAARWGPSASRPSGEGGRRRWLAVGFVGALVVVLLVAREIGASLDTAGSRAGHLPTAGTTTGQAPGASAALPRSSAGEAAVSPVVETPRRPAGAPSTAGPGGRSGHPGGLGGRASGPGGPSGPGGRPRPRSRAQPDPSGRSRPQPARAAVQAPSRPVGPARGSSNPGRGTGPQASTPGPAQARAVSRSRRGGGRRTSAVTRGQSPAGEFGFER